MAAPQLMEKPVATNSISGVLIDPDSVYISKPEYRMQKYSRMNDLAMEMSFISVLTIRLGKKRSVKNLLSGFGVQRWCTFSAFLTKLHVTKVIAMLHNWILREIQHYETVTYRILEDYTDDVYQLSLASRKGGLYVTRIQKHLDLKDKLLYYWDEDITFATLTRAKIEKSMQDADHFNATQLPGHLPDKETNHHFIMRCKERQRPVPYVMEQVKSSKD